MKLKKFLKETFNPDVVDKKKDYVKEEYKDKKKFKKQSWFDKHPILKWILIILAILFVLSVFSPDEKDCGEETFYIDSSGPCSEACDTKCYDEGFSPDESIGLFEYFYDSESPDYYGSSRRCTCECMGCRE